MNDKNPLDGYSEPGEYTERVKNMGTSPQYPDPGPYVERGNFGPGYERTFAPANPEKNGLGLAAVILGPIGLLFAIIPLTGFIAVILGVVGLALGLAGYSRVRKNKATNGKTAITGIVLSLLALVIGVIGIVIVFNATAELGDDLDCISNADTSAQIEAC